MRRNDRSGSHRGGLPPAAPTPGGHRGRRPRIGESGQAENGTSLTLIGLARTCSTELVGERTRIHEDSASPVREGRTPGGIPADRVALDHVPTGERAEKLDANRSIAGDQVAAADRVVRGVVDEDAVLPIRDRRGPSGIRADQVALNLISRGRPTRPTRDLEPDQLVARNDIAPHGVRPGVVDQHPDNRVVQAAVPAALVPM